MGPSRTDRRLTDEGKHIDIDTETDEGHGGKGRSMG